MFQLVLVKTGFQLIPTGEEITHVGRTGRGTLSYVDPMLRRSASFLQVLRAFIMLMCIVPALGGLQQWLRSPLNLDSLPKSVFEKCLEMPGGSGTRL